MKTKTSFIEDLTPLRDPTLADALQKLEDLMSQNNRVFLLGAGCSRCAGLPLTSELTDHILKSATLKAPTKGLLTTVAKCFEGTKAVTIEDYLSELVDLLAIVQRREERGAKEKSITIGKTDYTASQIEDAIDDIKQQIAKNIEEKTVDIATHREFVRLVHRTLRSGKDASNKPTDYIILNYDTLIEDALSLEQLTYCDGFLGGPSGWWDSAGFNKEGFNGRVLKVHGSIDWCLLEKDLLPRRIRPGNGLSSIVPKEKVLIWPASTKYRETQLDPYAQILNITRAALRPNGETQTVLTICGYSFGDTHINLEIDRALRESEERLTVLVFTELSKPEGQLETWMKDPKVNKQVRIHAKGGFFHGQTAIQSKKDLPWWRFETLCHLLGGAR